MKLLLLLLLSTSCFAGNYCHKIRVAVVDTGLDLEDPRFKDHLCKTDHKDFTGTGIRDVNGHGTHIAGIIQQYAKDSNYCLLIYKYYLESASGKQNLDNEVRALEEATKNKVDIVNFSGGGPESSETEYDVIDQNPQITFVVAAGNEHENIDLPGNGYYPASYDLDNIVSVGNIDKYGVKTKSSNWGSRIVWENGENVFSTIPCRIYRSKLACNAYMSGTSMSTAVWTGKLVDKLSKSCNSR
jgi:subtilisin family serine protease